MNTKAVIYTWQKHKKINGTLFYCFEYFLQLSILKEDVIFYIIDIPDKDKEYIIKLFKDKYKEEFHKFINITQISRTKLGLLNLSDILVLDIKTYSKISPFIKASSKINLFYNEDASLNAVKIRDNTTTFGTYNYQCYQKKCILKIGLSFQKEYNTINKGVFISCPEFSMINEKTNSILLKKNIVYKKELNKFHEGLFNNINEIIYVHIGLDKNNRIIPESFYHNKKCTVIKQTDTIDIIDSVDIRYQDCLDGNINKYILNKNDKIIKEMMNGYK